MRILLPKKGLYANQSVGLCTFSLSNAGRLFGAELSKLCKARSKILLLASWRRTCKLATSNEECPRHNNLGSICMSSCRVKQVCLPLPFPKMFSRTSRGHRAHQVTCQKQRFFFQNPKPQLSNGREAGTGV